MKDKYNREIDYLRLSVTDKCNLGCLYCMGDDEVKESHVLDDENILNIVQEAVQVGIKKVRVTGGEPLVRKGIYKLLKNISLIHGIEEITLTTNGFLLDGNIHLLKDANVSRVNISLDSLQNERLKTITKSNHLFDYKKVIRDLQDAGITPVKINTVLLKGINEDEILDFYHFADTYQVEVRFIELMPFESGSFNYTDYYLSKDEIVQKYNLIQTTKKNNVTFYKHKEFQSEIGIIESISNKFCQDCNRLRITSDGFIRPCLHSNKEIKIDYTSSSISEAIKEAIQQKPKEHDLDKEYEKKSTKSMNKIGG